MTLRHLVGIISRRVAPQHYTTIFVQELPEQLQARILFVELSGGKPWMAALLCPCGCEEPIELSLLHDDEPHWRLRVNWYSRPLPVPLNWRPQPSRCQRCPAIYWTPCTVSPWSSQNVPPRVTKSRQRSAHGAPRPALAPELQRTA